MPTVILSNPLGSDDAQRIGLSIREYRVGELVTVNDFAAVTLIRTGYALAVGTAEDPLLIGDGPPNESIGADGQWYLDKYDEVLWGPKYLGVWPDDPIRPDRGVSNFHIDPISGHLIVTYSTGFVVDLGNVLGQGYGGGFVLEPTDPGQPLQLTIVSNWGLRADGSAYYSDTGALPAEAALLVPDPTTGTFGLFRPGAPYTDQLDPRLVELVGDTASGLYGALADAFATQAEHDALAAELDSRADGLDARATNLENRATTAEGRILATEGVANAAIPATQKAAANGVATLGADGLIPSTQLPPLAITDVFPVADQAAMLALAAQPGDVAIRADGTGSWILRAAPATTLGNWNQLKAPTDVVTSVDGKTGAVSLGTTAATANELARRDASGRLKATDPAAADDVLTLGYGSGLLTSFGRDLGTGTTLPTAVSVGSALRRGDVYYHTAWGCLLAYNGAAWRQVGPAELTNAQRVALSTTGLYNGFRVYETDTLTLWIWNGAVWARLDTGPWTDLLRSVSYSFTPANGSAYADLATSNYTINNLPVGRELEVEWKAPLVAALASASLFLRLLLAGTAVDSAVFSTGSAPMFGPGRLTGSLVVPASGSVQVQVQGYSGAGASLTTISGGAAGGAVVLRYRIA